MSEFLRDTLGVFERLNTIHNLERCDIKRFGRYPKKIDPPQPYTPMHERGEDNNLVLYHGSHLAIQSICSITENGFSVTRGEETLSDCGPFGGDSIRFSTMMKPEIKFRFGVVFEFTIPKGWVKQSSGVPGQMRYSLVFPGGEMQDQTKSVIPPENISGSWLVERNYRDLFYLGDSPLDIKARIQALKDFEAE